MRSHIGLLVWLWILVVPFIAMIVLSGIVGRDRR
jgi:hypothetical protein